MTQNEDRPVARTGKTPRSSAFAAPAALFAALAVSLAATACAGGAPAETGPAPADAEPSSGAESPGDAAAEEGSRSHLEELEAIYRARVDSARMEVAQADVDFMTGMIGHHAQALVMSRMAPTHGASEPLQVMAARIINAQQDEIDLMQTWLRDRGQPAPEVEIDGTTLMVHGAEHAMHMPGMLTDEQMAELDAARGREFDRLFLTYMIQHHEGAVTMVLDLFGTDGAAQDGTTFKLASDIQADQRSEIDRMKRMLRALSDGGE